MSPDKGDGNKFGGMIGKSKKKKGTKKKVVKKTVFRNNFVKESDS